MKFIAIACAVSLAIIMGEDVEAKEVTIVPQWTVKVVDQSGAPVTGLAVAQNWNFFGLWPKRGGNDSRKTDAHGLVVFPEQSFSVSGGAYLAGRGMSALNVHASFGPTGTVGISPAGYKQVSAYSSTDGKVYDRPGATTLKDKHGFTTKLRVLPLDVFDLIDNRDWAAVKRMLATDVSIATARDRGETTPLIYLSASKSSDQKTELITLMLAAGADINARSGDGTTALHNAAEHCDVPAMELLLSKGADPKLKLHDSVYYATNGFTPLHFVIEASGAQKTAGIKCLLSKGADINAKDSKGATPLHLAALWGGPEIVTALLALGADPQAKDLRGQTPLASIKSLEGTPSVQKIRKLLGAAEAQKADAPRPSVP
ncbi:MAG: ankyrin repeat domain-containing protein [Rariglobus sp.]